jgi:hypothetical protein
MNVDMTKNFEAHFRRLARKQGLSLRESRCRTEFSPDYGGYMLVNTHNNTVAHGCNPNEFSLDLRDLDAILMP